MCVAIILLPVFCQSNAEAFVTFTETALTLNEGDSSLVCVDVMGMFAGGTVNVTLVNFVDELILTMIDGMENHSTV